MKRAIILIIILILLFTFSACSNKAGNLSSVISNPQILSSNKETSSNDKSSSVEENQSASSQEDSNGESQNQISSNTPIPALIPSSPTSAGYGYVQESARVDPSYFSDAVFIGDSVSLKLEYYDSAYSTLGGAKYLASGSLGSGNALWEISSDSVHPSYQGNKVYIEDGVAAIGAKKVYIMLGMNDIGVYGIDGSIENYKTLVSKILAKSPEAKIYAQSVTPMTATSSIAGSSLNNQKIVEYNQKLLSTCEENNWYFVDVASVMHDENGYLKTEYCSEPTGMGIHFTETGCKAWVDYLYTHTSK